MWSSDSGKESEQTLSPILQPGSQEGSILLQQRKLLNYRNKGANLHLVSPLNLQQVTWSDQVWAQPFKGW